MPGKNLFVALRAIIVGMILVAVGSIPKNLIFAANLKHHPEIPWLIVPTLLFLWVYWRYLNGSWWPKSTAQARREGLRADSLSAWVWSWALFAGALGIVALVFVLRVINRMVVLPEQKFFDVAQIPIPTVIAIIVVGALAAGVVEEASFRGYMQGPIERRFGIGVAILVTGFMFAVAHLGLTPILIPYYIAVSAIYGTVAYFTNSIRPCVVLHTAGNIFSSTYLWRTGHAEWQASPDQEPLIWQTGADTAFLQSAEIAGGALVAAIAAYAVLKLVASPANR